VFNPTGTGGPLAQIHVVEFFAPDGEQQFSKAALRMYAANAITKPAARAAARLAA